MWTGYNWRLVFGKFRIKISALLSHSCFLLAPSNSPHAITTFSSCETWRSHGGAPEEYVSWDTKPCIWQTGTCRLHRQAGSVEASVIHTGTYQPNNTASKPRRADLVLFSHNSTLLRHSAYSVVQKHTKITSIHNSRKLCCQLVKN
jgi:hypothetical protein